MREAGGERDREITSGRKTGKTKNAFDSCVSRYSVCGLSINIHDSQ